MHNYKGGFPICQLEIDDPLRNDLEPAPLRSVAAAPRLRLGLVAESSVRWDGRDPFILKEIQRACIGPIEPRGEDRPDQDDTDCQHSKSDRIRSG